MPTRSAFITGIFGLLSLVLGYFLKPAEKAIFSPHCDIGGVWVRSHENLKGHCEVVKFANTNDFLIKSQGSFGGENFLLTGKGIITNDIGSFTGTFVTTNRESGFKQTINVSGDVGLQGCHSLGVKLSLGEAYVWCYVRDSESNVDMSTLSNTN